jgi:TATA-box binding protein (TBP) (component of TFIID and TFIIIB)
MDLDDEWTDFLNDTESHLDQPPSVDLNSSVAPESTALYISTNTVISYLNQPIPLIDIFWKLIVIPYHEPREGIIKKQIKLNSNTPGELHDIDTNITSSSRYGYRTTIKHIENERGNIKYKNVSKITIGISKKDIISYRLKQKGAFYNCFVLILRVLIDENFKEFHIKIFNTGKIEIPGIQNKLHLPYIIQILMNQLQVHYPDLSYNKEHEEIVLINSNFNCGYFINRDSLYHKLRYEKGISAVYDPCSYPGIQCKIYYTEDGQIVTTPVPKNTVSFMIFRTGSILIVGKCSLEIIHKIYDYIVSLLHDSFQSIVDHKCTHIKPELFKKRVKKTILIK